MKFKKLLSAVAATAIVASAFAGLAVTASAAVDTSTINTFSESKIFNFESETVVDNITTETNEVVALNNGLYYYAGGTATGSKIEAVDIGGYTKAFNGANGDTGKAVLAFRAGADGTVSIKFSSTTVGDIARINNGINNDFSITTANTIETSTAVNVSADSIVYISSRNTKNRVSIYEIDYTVGVEEEPDPTEEPEATTEPTAEPTADPTTEPTTEPTTAPTATPTTAPELVAVSTETTWTGASFDVVDQSSGTIFAKDATMKIDCNNKQVKTTADNIYLNSGNTIITIHPEADGVITVNASSSNNTAARDVVIGGTTVAGGAPGRSNGSADSKVEITGGSDITIKFSGGGGYINSIKYEPGATLAKVTYKVFDGVVEEEGATDAPVAVFGAEITPGTIAAKGITWNVTAGGATTGDQTKDVTISGASNVYIGFLVTLESEKAIAAKGSINADSLTITINE